MPAYNALVGAPPAAADPPLVGPGGFADAHPMTGGRGGTVAGSTNVTLAIMLLGAVALLGALDLAGFKSTITIGRS